VTVSASTAQCHEHSNIKAPELLEQLSSASQMLLGALLPKMFCQIRAYYARSGRRQALASQLLPANLWKKLEGLVPRDIADLMWRGVVRLSR
jgi:hypothetical protein